MLKRRIIPVLLFNDGVLFRTRKFVPDYRYTQAFVGAESADEIFLIDVTPGGPSPASRESMRAYGDRCFAPVTMGGHVRSLDDFKAMFDLGADKVVTAEIAAPRLLTDAAHKFGAQSVVSGLAGSNLGALAELMTKCGAGEIFVQSVERDGSLDGYDLDLARSVVKSVSVPVVIGGGCGGWRHMAEAFDAGCDGAATSNIFHFTDGALTGFKRELAARGYAVREAA